MKNKKEKLEVEITSLPDRENVVAELWQGDFLFAELSSENDNKTVQIQIYNHPNQKMWEFELENLLSFLIEASEIYKSG